MGFSNGGAIYLSNIPLFVIDFINTVFLSEIFITSVLLQT